MKNWNKLFQTHFYSPERVSWRRTTKRSLSRKPRSSGAKVQALSELKNGVKPYLEFLYDVGPSTKSHVMTRLKGQRSLLSVDYAYAIRNSDVKSY